MSKGATSKRTGAAAPAVSATAGPVLEISDLTVSVRGEDGERPVVSDLSFSLARGETLCIAGESGSGKSMTALAIMQLLPQPAARIESGTIRLRDLDRREIDLAVLDERRMRRIRGDRIAMIFQEPMTSLNPVLSIGRQLVESIEAHTGLSRAEARRRAIEALKAVRISEAESRLKQFPHELSGGMRQRVMIAMALALKPDVLIADEPTTALDVTVQGEVLELLRDLQREHGTSIILITHDMGVVAEMADRVVIMRHGRMVEQGTAADIFARPQADYTRELLAAVPRIGTGVGRPEQKSAEAEMRGSVAVVNDLHVHFDLRGGFFGQVNRRVHAVEGISFSIAPHETLALVGESGCGKSTTAKALAGLVPYHGDIVIGGRNLAGLGRDQRKAVRRDVQMIFQDPYASLDPRMRVGDLVAEPLLIHGIGSKEERSQLVAALFERVGLSADQMELYPHEFSGGQRQRICIAARFGAQAQTHHRRRKRFGARRVGAGPRARPVEGTAARIRHRLSVHLARYGGGREHFRSCRRHVSRPDRRNGHPRPGLFEPAPPLHQALDRSRAGARSRATPAAFRASRSGDPEPDPKDRRDPTAFGSNGCRWRASCRRGLSRLESGRRAGIQERPFRSGKCDLIGFICLGQSATTAIRRDGAGSSLVPCGRSALGAIQLERI